MTFNEIFPQFLEGKKITRRLWPQNKYFCVEDITINVKGKQCKLDEKCLKDNDWRVIEDE